MPADEEGFLGKARREARIVAGVDVATSQGKRDVESHGIRAVACAAVSIAESLASIAESLSSLDADGIETYTTPDRRPN